MRDSIKRSEEKLFEVIKTAFMQKRKTLLNALANSNKYGSKKQICKTLELLSIDNRVRPEKLTLEEFAKIADEI